MRHCLVSSRLHWGSKGIHWLSYVGNEVEIYQFTELILHKKITLFHPPLSSRRPWAAIDDFNTMPFQENEKHPLKFLAIIGLVYLRPLQEFNKCGE